MIHFDENVSIFFNLVSQRSHSIFINLLNLDVIIIHYARVLFYNYQDILKTKMIRVKDYLI